VDEYIGFTGPPELVPVLKRFLEEVARTKQASPEGVVVEDRVPVIQDGKWIDLLPETVIERLVAPETWDLEDILDCLLTGEYELTGVELADGEGRLLYEPLAFPFGGTDPLKATLEAFGFSVTEDSFHDGFAEYLDQRFRSGE
jgi:hypothetical protein